MNPACQASGTPARDSADRLLDNLDLSVFEICSPADLAKIDDELVCTACGGVLCDVEHGDSMSLLVGMCAEHADRRPANTSAPTPIS